MFPCHTESQTTTACVFLFSRIDRSQGCILSHRNVATSQNVPEVHFWGAKLWVIPFDLVLSPLTYTKCVDAELARLQLQGILNYIDNWLILALSRVLDLRHRDVILAYLQSLGLILNDKKSIFSPTQRTMY